ncbi:pyridoxal phosphate-dependent aminotransferase [Nocardia barduliensis]|uniref:pyridoxal phosphate-dependent aminotransferase n=1 Tax=Nocardia barduliensis TaxID=2736643 RepID=UPI00157182C7|nr:pyridoxal phosphate-dependent aminotransferase [Nocardia barduliensis]
MTDVADYLKYIRSVTGVAAYDLASSGLPQNSQLIDSILRNVPAGVSDQEIGRVAVADRYGTSPEHVWLSRGASAGVSLGLAALSRQFEHPCVAIETPSYKNFASVAAALRIQAVPIDRTVSGDWSFRDEVIRRTLSEGVQMVCITNPHNPSGRYLTDLELDSLSTTCAEYGAVLLVDEVFRDFADPDAGTAFDPTSKTVITCGSLSKCYGLGALRVGWLLANRDFILDVATSDETMHGQPGHLHSALTFSALSETKDVISNSRHLVDMNREIIVRWANATPGFEPIDFSRSGYVLIRVVNAIDVSEFCKMVLVNTSIAVVPGSLFDSPGTIRISATASTSALEISLKLLASQADELLM